ncbi:hypothetical protein BD413DRAFT_561541 [Trametes elegans]|nr:hypothetical protein BD413DRAFT_561541 [Trametes elegans]
MDADDNYFDDDDFVLDDTVLAVVDQVEKDYKEAQRATQQPKAVGERPPVDAPPPLKKQKTAHEWEEGTSELPKISVDQPVPSVDDEGLPEVSVIGGGSYKFPAAQRAAANALAAQLGGQAETSDSRQAPVRDTHVVPPPVEIVPQRSAAVSKPPSAPPAPAPSPAPSPAPAPAHNSPGAAAPSRLSTPGSASVGAAAPVRVVPPPPPPLAGSSRNSPALLPNPGPAPVYRQSPAALPNKPPSSGIGRPLRRGSTLSSIQAALADFVPPTNNPTPDAEPPRQLPPSTSSRHSVKPATSRPSAQHVPSRRYATPPSAPSQSRHHVPPQGPATSNVSRRPVQPPTAPGNRRMSVPVAVPSRPLARASPPVQQRQSQQPPPLSQGPSDRAIRLELITLRAQMDELLKAQEEAKRALEEAKHVRYAKEGEVSILRKNMEQTSKEHAAEVARIKAAREQAEAAQAQLRKELAEEKERLRTQYMFKQLEVETSVRKTPWSVRLKRTENQGPSTPVTGSQRRHAAIAVNGNNGGRSSIYDTPSRTRIDKAFPNSPERLRRRTVVDSPPPKKPAKLPGFHNAFDPSPMKSSLRFSQLSQSTQVRGKGKEKAKEREDISINLDGIPAEDLFFNPPSGDVRAQSPAPKPPQEAREEGLAPDKHVQKDSSGPSSSAEPVSSPAEDVVMKDETKPEELREHPEPLQVPDWIKELHRIVLTHKHHGAKQPTLQLLMNNALPTTAPPERVEQYSSLSAKLLDSLGTATLKITDTDNVIHSVGQTLTAMGRILNDSGFIPHLSALLDLMKVIALFVSRFVSLALTPADGGDGGDAPPEILLLLSDVVRAHFGVKERTTDCRRDDLASEALGLLETICWYMPPVLAPRLSVFIRKAGVLSTLVDTAQPTWLLQRAMRALNLAASYHTLWKNFLSFPLPETPQAEAAAKDYTRIPHIEQLAALLTDRTRDGPDCRRLRDSILNFVTTLVTTHNDALTILIKSHTLLPSIVVFLNDITTPLWEEDESFMKDAELVTWTIQAMTRTVLLLHYLMTKADASRINLRTKLTHPPKRFANALWHMFMVSLGRISYACPPDWAGLLNVIQLDQVCDLAKDVLEVVVDGPELESIWAAFHVDDNLPAPTTLTDEESDAPHGTLPPAVSRQ